MKDDKHTTTKRKMKKATFRKTKVDTSGYITLPSWDQLKGDYLVKLAKRIDFLEAEKEREGGEHNTWHLN